MTMIGQRSLVALERLKMALESFPFLSERVSNCYLLQVTPTFRALVGLRSKVDLEWRLDRSEYLSSDHLRQTERRLREEHLADLFIGINEESTLWMSVSELSGMIQARVSVALGWKTDRENRACRSQSVLSPDALLNNQINHSLSVEELTAFIPRLVTPTHYSTFIHRLARLSGRLRPSPLAEPVPATALSPAHASVVEALLDQSARLSPREVCTSAWSLSRLAVPHWWTRLPLLASAPRVPPPGLVALLDALSTVDDQSAVDDLWTSLVPLANFSMKCQRLSPVEVATCCYAAARAGRTTDRSLFRTASRQISAENLPTWPSRQLALLVWSMCTAGHVQWAALRQCVAELTRRSSDSVSLIDFAWYTIDYSLILFSSVTIGLSRANIQGEDAFLSAQTRFLRAHSLPQDVASLVSILHGVAKLASADDRLHGDHRRDPQREAFPQSLGWLQPAVIERISHHVMSSLGGPDTLSPLECRSLSSLAYSLSSLGLADPRVSQMVDTLDLPALAKTSLSDACILAWSLAACGRPCPALSRACLGRLAAMDCDSSEMLYQACNLLWTLAVADEFPEEACAFADRLSEKVRGSLDASTLHHFHLARALHNSPTESRPFLAQSWRQCNRQWAQSGQAESLAQRQLQAWIAATDLPFARLASEEEIAPGLLVDIFLVLQNGERVLVEVDGPSHFAFDLAAKRPLTNGASLLRRRLLSAQLRQGDRLVHVPYWKLAKWKKAAPADRTRDLLLLLSQVSSPPIY